jgi:aspartate beta-hydroxylase
LSPQLPDLQQRARQALAERRPKLARDLLQQIVALAPQELANHLNLAVACRLDGDLDGAMQAVEVALGCQPRDFLALLMKATLLEAKGQQAKAATAYGIALTQAPPLNQLDPPTRGAVEHARQIQARHLAMMQGELERELDNSHITGNSAEAKRMQSFVEHLLGKRRIYHSAPLLFYYPGLPSIEFHPRERFPWLAEVEAMTPAIQGELAKVMADPDSAGLEPYVQTPAGMPADQFAELDRSKRWSAYHFWFYGQPYEDHRRQCPQTAALLDRLPQPHIPKRSPAALFSILDPKTHIPPHNGAANTRLLCHLPLVLPPNCRFRVGNEIRQWQMGEAFVFDDTIEHEAWNDSDQIRIVLIFDVWNPLLSEAERDLVTRSLAAVDRLNDADPEMGI